MKIRIDPPIVTLEPNQRQIFTAEAEPPPAMWVGVADSGDIKSDYSLEVDAAGSQVSGAGGHRLYSGIGIIEFTIDDQVLPTSTNEFQITAFLNDVNGFQYSYSLQISASAVEVRDEANNQIYTESYSTDSGDVYRLEIASGFRFYRKNVGDDEFTLKHSRVGLATVVIYPASYLCMIAEATVASPTRIPPPRLIGDWRLSQFVNFTAPSHGSITTAGPSNQTEYFGGTIPGTYTLTAQMEASADADDIQLATATIVIDPLKLLGPSEITIQPGAKIRPKTNYSDALVTWSVVSGGGSFTQGEFTAPLTHGVSVIRAFADINDQVADITVTVAPVISDAAGYTAAKAGEEIDFDHNLSLFPRFIGLGSVGDGTGDVTAGLPEGFRVNDVWLLIVETANQAVTGPGGWVAVADSPQGTGTGGDAAATRLSIFWRRATAIEVAATITDPGDHAVAQILGFRDCIDSGNPWDVTSGDVQASAQTGVSIPGDTTTGPNCLVVLAVSNGTDTATSQTSGYTNGDLANLTERTDANRTAGNGGGFAVATGEKAAAGAYGATSATLATSSTQGRMSIALKPATITWSASAGSINSSSGVWTAPSLAGQTARIAVTNGAITVILEVPVLEVFPLDDPILPVTWDRSITALVGMSEDRSNRITREKSPPHDSYPIKFASRTLAECVAVDAFFDAHGFGKMFILDDTVRGIRKVGWFDSPIRHEARDECDIDLAFQFIEAT